MMLPEFNKRIELNKPYFSRNYEIKNRCQRHEIRRKTLQEELKNEFPYKMVFYFWIIRE
jgi:hypothetical protein